MNKLTEEISVAIAYAKCCDNTDSDKAIIDQASESVKKVLREGIKELTFSKEDADVIFIEDLDNFIDTL